MDIYAVRILETVEKMVMVHADDAQEAQYYASEMNDDEFDFNKVVGSKSTAVKIAEGDTDEDIDDDSNDDPCDGFNDCDDCPNYCEVCGSCAKEADFVPNRGKCAGCEYRCSACYACTIDD